MTVGFPEIEDEDAAQEVGVGDAQAASAKAQASDSTVEKWRVRLDMFSPCEWSIENGSMVAGHQAALAQIGKGHGLLRIT